MEFEVSPQLPTSGQLLGVLVETMGFQDAMLRDRTAKRFFKGRRDGQVKELSRRETLAAIVDTLANLGFETTPQSEDELPFHSVLASILDAQTVNWDRLRAYLLPRMMRVYPSDLATLWKAYLRLASIDVALRVAALLHHTGASETALDFLEWADVTRRGGYLNQQRKKAGVSLIDFPAAAGVFKSTAEGWFYHGARPQDDNLLKIGEALAPREDPQERDRIVRDLRLLYWTSDVAAVLGKHVGVDVVNEIVSRLHRYTLQALRIIHGEEATAGGGPVDHLKLVLLGVHAPGAEPLLTALAILEGDGEWKDDLLAASRDWVGRVLEVNLQIHQAEVEDLIRRTDGRILERWDVRNPKAYEHYQRSLELQAQGRMPDALAEVAKAVDLDPLDPVNHFTLGSGLGGIGGMTGDAGLVYRGIQACWLAHALAPDWILPWTEIGRLLLGLGSAEEAVAHLERVPSTCGPLDARYYAALGSAQRQVGEHAAALGSFEASLQLNPDDSSVTVAAAVAAFMAGDKITSNRHGKAARFLGAGALLDRSLGLVKAMRAAMPTVGDGGGDRVSASQDAAIMRDPENAAAYVARARSHFLEGEDGEAVSDLDAALRLDASNVGGLLLRGIVHGYMGSHERAIADMSQAIGFSPGNAMAHYYRGLSYGELNTLELAIADFDEVTRQDSGFVQAYQARGECRLYRGEYEAAIADFDTAIELDTEGARPYRGRGAAFRMQGAFDRAIADFDTALSIDPDDPYAYRFRGDAYLARGDYDRAIADFSVSLHLAPNSEACASRQGQRPSLQRQR